MDEVQSIRELAMQAESILEAEAFKTFVERTVDRLVNDWKICTSTEGREAIWYRMQGLTDLLTEMGIALSDREMLEADEKRKKRSPLA